MRPWSLIAKALLPRRFSGLFVATAARIYYLAGDFQAMSACLVSAGPPKKSDDRALLAFSLYLQDLPPASSLVPAVGGSQELLPPGAGSIVTWAGFVLQHGAPSNLVAAARDHALLKEELEALLTFLLSTGRLELGATILTNSRTKLGPHARGMFLNALTERWRPDLCVNVVPNDLGELTAWDANSIGLAANAIAVCGDMARAVQLALFALEREPYSPRICRLLLGLGFRKRLEPGVPSDQAGVEDPRAAGRRGQAGASIRVSH